MNIKIRALLIASGTGIFASILFAIPANYIFPMLGGLVYICGLTLNIGIGALYAFLHSREASLQINDAVIGGALAGALSSLVSAICSQIMFYIFLISISNQLGGIDGLGAGMLGGLISICVSPFPGAILGAVGGAITDAFLGNKSP